MRQEGSILRSQESRHRSTLGKKKNNNRFTVRAVPQRIQNITRRDTDKDETRTKCRSINKTPFQILYTLRKVVVVQPQKTNNRFTVRAAP